jgi:hypothetical protein
MAGPSFEQNLVIGSESNVIGQVSDAMLTVADLLGVKNEVATSPYIAPGTDSFIHQIEVHG